MPPVILQPQTHIVTESEAGMRLDRWLRQRLGQVPQSLIEMWTRKGRVRVEGQRAKPSTRLVAGQTVQLPPLASEESFTKPRKLQSKMSNQDRETLTKAVLYQDSDLIVINKPYGLAVQGGTGTVKHLDDWLDVLQGDQSERPRLVHRLDKDTSGVLLLARHRQAAQWLTQAFKEQSIKKTYWAIVVGVPAAAKGMIDASIAKRAGRAGEKMAIGGEGAKTAQTRYRVLQVHEAQEEGAERLAWLELSPLTGRTHQLRVHCAHLGTPILGDGKYGGASSHPEIFGKRSLLHLHAREITVPYPNGERKKFVAPLPHHIHNTLKYLHFFEKN